VYEDSGWLPTRLIHVGTHEKPALHLIESAKLPSNTRYSTLSYCWGSHVATDRQHFDYYESIPLDALSTTAQQSIHVSRSLGLAYMWIDGLCIMQDDPDDWLHESTLMSRVYGFSTCTIAAACADDAQGGFFRQREQFRVRPLRITNPFNPDSQQMFQISSQYLGPIYEKEVQASTWHDRSWVFQERLLSQRMLIFGEQQVMWACQKIQAAETCPGGKTGHDYIDQFESFEVERRRLQALLESNRLLNSGDIEWETVITQYTKTQTSRMSDRLIALQGIADRITLATGRKYAAGVWLDESLPRTLLWHTLENKLLPRPKTARSPTWSWASVDSPVQYSSNGTRGDFLHARKIELCKPQEAASLTKSTFAELFIEAPFLNAVLSIQTVIDKNPNSVPASATPLAEIKLGLKRPDYEPQTIESSNLVGQAVHATAEKSAAVASQAAEKSRNLLEAVSVWLERHEHVETFLKYFSIIVGLLLAVPLVIAFAALFLSLLPIVGIYILIFYAIAGRIPFRERQYVIPDDPGPPKRTFSMLQGNAYGLSQAPRKPSKPDPHITSNCHIDTTEHLGGSNAEAVLSVGCLIILRSNTLIGLLVRPCTDSKADAARSIPRYRRIGMFEVDRLHPYFANLESHLQEIVLT
jgi:hypothetical protein